ncbi:hypothetical protein UlMin_006539 [Ulmus minor]
MENCKKIVAEGKGISLNEPKEVLIKSATKTKSHGSSTALVAYFDGNTARTAPVFGPGGHAYVYLCYGLHTMLNVVADKEGNGAAVLIRLETIQQHRGQKTNKPVLLTGPRKLVGSAKYWGNWFRDLFP